MAVYETEALILKNYSLADADKIAVFLTRNYGIVKGVAKGAKKLNSRYGSTLEPFTTVDLTYFIKDDHDLASIREIEIRQSFFHTSTYPEVLKTLSYFGKLLLEFVPPNEPGDKTYRMVTACLEAIKESPEYLDRLDRLDAVTLYFEAWLLRLSGFLPDWSKCVICGRAFAENDAAVLEAALHLSHMQCQPHRREPLVTVKQRSMMTQLQTLSPKDFALRFADGKTDCCELSQHMQSIVTHVVGRDIENTKYILPEELIAGVATPK